MNHQTEDTAPSSPVSQPPSPIDTATIELLELWRVQDATDDPEELLAAEQELIEFKKAMNENRVLAGELPLYR